MLKTKILKGHKLEKHIEVKRQRLEFAKKELKEHFVGIDSLIDQLIDYAEVWYSTPEILSRPMIVCLWGPTGVGKTDLVRRFAKLIDFSDHYCEIELANKNTTSWNKSISSILRSNSVDSGVPSIVLLDEIQGFRTIDEDGDEIQDYDLKDIWTLLSDGRLPYTVDQENLMALLWKYNKSIATKEREKIENTKKKVASKNKRKKSKGNLGKYIGIDIETIDDDDGEGGFYEIQHFKSQLRLDEPIEEIALWSDKKKRDLIVKRLYDKSIFDEEDYTKTLIIISGNLDEAYGFTKDAKEVDLDADLLHEISKRVTILDIKGALSKRFRPEQISRMGNNHIIYPTLSGESFRKIIDRKVDSVCARVNELADITLSVDESLKRLIYDNGVYPTQGTRPLFSTISEILECNLPKIIVNLLLHESDKATIEYANSEIIMNIDGTALRKPFVGTLDAIKRKRDLDINRKTISSVHEAGHAVAYAILFGQTPTQIVSTPISEDMGDGFVYFKDMELMSKGLLLNKICALLAGHEAERFVFGNDDRSSGNSSDLEKATNIAAQMVRLTGMYGTASQVKFEEDDLFNNDTVGTNPQIEAVIVEQRDRAFKLMQDHETILTMTIDKLLISDRIVPADFKKICEDNGVKVIEAKANDEPRYWESHNRYIEFKNRKQGVTTCTTTQKQLKPRKAARRLPIKKAAK